MFDRVSSVFKFDGPSVGLGVDTSVTWPGASVSGRVRVQGGKEGVLVDRVRLGMTARTWVEVRFERRLWLCTTDFHDVVVRRELWVPAGEAVELPFTLPVPSSTPITVVGDVALPVMVDLWTQVVALDALDATDLVRMKVRPLPSQNRVLDAFGALGAFFTSIDGERGKHEPADYSLTLTFVPPWWSAGAVTKVGLTFAVDERRLDVVLVATRRGVWHTRREVPGRFTMTHEEAEVADWTSLIGTWLAGIAA